MIMKRGISPLVATAFLFGFAIVIAITIIASTSNLNQDLLDEQDKKLPKQWF